MIGQNNEKNTKKLVEDLWDKIISYTEIVAENAVGFEQLRITRDELDTIEKQEFKQRNDLVDAFWVVSGFRPQWNKQKAKWEIPGEET